jgi:uncharacterized RDD family membrane protein YckC
MRNDGRHAPLDTVTDIDTPERTRFSCRLAGPGPRALAYLLDCAVRGAGLAMLAAVVMGAGIGGKQLSGVGTGLALVALFVVEWCYYVACELWLDGQSFGKRALKLRVVCNDGLPIGLRESILRNLLRAADFLPGWYAIGGLVMSLDPQFRRLGDLVAGTFVIVEGSEPILPAIAISPEPTLDELRTLPAHVAFAAEELDAIDHLMRRKLNLPSARVQELATLLAPRLAQRLNLQYADPVRFLALLYHRATHPRGA